MLVTFCHLRKRTCCWSSRFPGRPHATGKDCSDYPIDPTGNYFTKKYSKKVITAIRIFKTHPEIKKKTTFLISELDQTVKVKSKGRICFYITKLNLLFANAIFLRELEYISVVLQGLTIVQNLNNCCLHFSRLHRFSGEATPLLFSLLSPGNTSRWSPRDRLTVILLEGQVCRYALLLYAREKGSCLFLDTRRRRASK